MKSRKVITFSILTVLLLILLFLNRDTFLGLGEASSTNIDEMGFAPMVEIEGNQKIMKMRSKYSSDKFQAGMNILIYGHPNMKEAKKVFEHLRSLGINSIALNFPFFQTDWQASEVSTDQVDTPTMKELRKLIEMAHDSGLSVMIRPIMDEQAFLSTNRWRGQIEPKNPDQWFDSYEALILSYAKLAESTNTKSLNIGTELSSLQNKYQNRWKALIESIRDVYSGELIYSFNYDTVSGIPSIEFVHLLDHVGIDAYFPLNVPDNASTEMLEEEWRKQLSNLQESLWDKSIIVTEVGILPITGAYRTPYVWSFPNGTYDTQAQINYYEATFNMWKPKVDGIYWWVIALDQDPDEISYSPLTLPTEGLIKSHYLSGEE
ncbi:hypothetical protein GGQ92_001139 [Gracilibacillus halotolerans]|uniref:Glycoside hydrolase family 5 domain-containing protein n=1 Tax=Gracilibacillus halotolerans TaxID=74386 RepID=A0A841RLM0_9BACI|nr:hypothetical protein [Gracilibacillus halotolerans]MBB6512356.1 hypothetical protein [Gracilibacillus halotolerans]